MANVDDWGSFNSGDEQESQKTETFHHPPSSAIIDMSTVDDSSNTSSFEDVSANQNKQSDEPDVMKGLSGNLGKVVADQMWESGQQQARKMIDIYANIDILRPYFDIEPKTLMIRIAQSFLPVKSFKTPQKIPSELYGPLMTVLTLIAILLMNMKTAGTVLQEGTLMGTAFGMCFGYWFGVSGFMYFIAYLCNTYISIVQCLSLLGYGMVSHCLILFLGYFTHYSHGMFYFLWAVVAGASAARIVTVLLSRTMGKSQRLMLCVSISTLHMLFLLYLHFAYHLVVEEILEVLDPNSNLKIEIGSPRSIRELDITVKPVEISP